MILIPILFLAVNIAFPVWLWSGTSNQGAKIDWVVLEKNVGRLVESDGGFPPCSPLEVVDVIRALCESSRDKISGNTSVAVERTGKEVVFSCEFKKDGILVNWYHEANSTDSVLKCGDPGGEMLAHAPGFLFVKNGRMKALEFVTDSGDLQTVPYRNCRVKAGKLKQFSLASFSEMESFLRALGSIPDDPQDYVTANQMCMVYDSSPLWRPWREKFLQ